jgi:hypothetical protein
MDGPYKPANVAILWNELLQKNDLAKLSKIFHSSGYAGYGSIRTVLSNVQELQQEKPSENSN